MLDLAQARWPEVSDRRQLLLRLAAEGHATIAQDAEASDGVQRRQRQREALARGKELVDADVLLSDAAWQ